MYLIAYSKLFYRIAQTLRAPRTEWKSRVLFPLHRDLWNRPSVCNCRCLHPLQGWGGLSSAPPLFSTTSLPPSLRVQTVFHVNVWECVCSFNLQERDWRGTVAASSSRSHGCGVRGQDQRTSATLQGGPGPAVSRRVRPQGKNNRSSVLQKTINTLNQILSARGTSKNNSRTNSIIKGSQRLQHF